MRVINVFFFSLLMIIVACQPYMVKPTSTDKAPTIRVLLKEISQKDSLYFKGSYILHSNEATYELGKNNKRLDVFVLNNGFKLQNPNRIFTFRDGDIIELTPVDENAVFKLGGLEYRGKIVLLKKSGTPILFINKLDLVNYLNGVVPSEMPATKEGYLEALKVQAICARTYALKRMLERKNQPFDVYASTQDQAYRGKTAERELSRQAIQATHGDVLMFNDTLATIYYSSTCGGLLESAQNVWPVSAYPHLQSGKDLLGDGFACSVSPHFRWQRNYNINDLDSLFALKFNRYLLKSPVKDTTRIVFKADVLERSSAGRVKKMQISYGDTSFVLKDFEIRRFFTDKNDGLLKSRFFTLSSNDSVFTINGAGYGHGVGMCQWGAMNMSEQGFKFYDILVNKYFKGTYLKKVY